MNKKNMWKIGGWLVLAVFLLACAIPSLTTPLPTQMLESQSMDALGTVIAQTAAAAQTQTATAMPSPTLTLTPSVTPTMPTPTATFYFSLLTTTPAVVIETNDPAYSAEGGTAYSGDSALSDSVPYTGLPWTCRGIEKSPPKGALIEPGKEFTASWTIQNTGTKPWTSNTIDFIYKSGYRPDGRIIQDLASFVPSGGKVTLKIKLTAPKAPGEYTAIWKLEVGKYSFCGMILTFEVPDK